MRTYYANMDLKDLYTQYCLRVDLYWCQKLLTVYLHQTLEGHIWCLESNNNLPTELNRIIYSYTLHTQKNRNNDLYIKAHIEGYRKTGGQKDGYLYGDIVDHENSANHIMYENVPFMLRAYKCYHFRRGLLALRGQRGPHWIMI